PGEAPACARRAKDNARGRASVQIRRRAPHLCHESRPYEGDLAWSISFGSLLSLERHLARRTRSARTALGDRAAREAVPEPRRRAVGATQEDRYFRGRIGAADGLLMARKYPRASKRGGAGFRRLRRRGEDHPRSPLVRSCQPRSEGGARSTILARALG